MPKNCAAIVIAAKHHELIKVKDTRGTTNTVGALRCRFEFRTDDWLHSVKTAMFCNGDALLHPEVANSAVPVVLDDDNECAVPFEVLTDTLPYSVGVWGVTNTGLRIVSKWLVFEAQDGCYVEGNEPIEPTPTVYEQIMVELGSKAPKDHEHNDIYYTREEIDSMTFEGGDVPASLIEEINKNTKARHSHTNKAFLDKFGEDRYGNPLYDGKKISSSVDGEAIQKEVESALAEAKTSGDFDGADGIGIETTEINAGGELVITYTDGNSANLGKVVGKDGVNGNDGIGIEQVVINADNELVVAYTDGQFANLGVVVGKDGQDGNAGADGIGIKRTEINASGELLIYYTNGQSAKVGTVVGKDGVSATHQWSGTVLTISSASGSSSVDLKGEKGDDGYTPIKGIDYFDGVKGDPFTYEDFTPEQLEVLKGADGKDGRDGIDGKDYVLTENDKTQIAEQAALLVDNTLLSIIGEVSE